MEEKQGKRGEDDQRCSEGAGGAEVAGEGVDVAGDEDDLGSYPNHPKVPQNQ